MVEVIHKSLEKKLAESLFPGEKIEVKIQGSFKEALICTDKRVLIIKSGFMTGQTFGFGIFQLPYKQIAGTQIIFHLLSGYFEISASGMQNAKKSYWASDSKTNASKAPNCISLNVKNKIKFQEVTNFILKKIHNLSNSSSLQKVQGSYDNDPITQIGKLSEMNKLGILTDSEFQEKKIELLKRIK